VTFEAGQPAGAAVGAVISKIQQDLTAAAGLIKVVGPDPTVRNMILGVQSDLADLLKAGQISNSKSVSNINLVMNELAALAEAFPATTQAASTASTIDSTATTAAPVALAAPSATA
jgi:hypothetical protein